MIVPVPTRLPLLRRTSDPVADAKGLLRVVLPWVEELRNGTRSVERRRARGHLCDVVSDFLLRLLAVADLRADAAEVLARLDDRQLFARCDVTLAAPSDELERLVIELSDLVATLKDPCHGSVWKYRRFGIARRPGSAMPLFQRPLTTDRDTTTLRDPASVQWRVVADRDALEWVEDPFAEVSFTSESDETYSILAPAVDRHGDVPIRRFSRWRGLSRASEFRLTERKRERGGVRIAKADPAIVGLYERDGHMVVNLQLYVLDLIDRRDPVMRPTDPPASVDAGLTAASAPETKLIAPLDRITPAEEEMEHFIAATEERLRAEFGPRIEQERAAGLFIDPSMRIGSPRQDSKTKERA